MLKGQRHNCVAHLSSGNLKNASISCIKLYDYYKYNEYEVKNELVKSHFNCCFLLTITLQYPSPLHPSKRFLLVTKYLGVQFQQLYQH